jgi:hypothetical protein
MIGIAIIDKYPRTQRVCSICAQRIERKESRIRTIERIKRNPDTLKISYYHILCANNSKDAKLESAILRYAYDLKVKVNKLTKLIKAIEDGIEHTTCI